MEKTLLNKLKVFLRSRNIRKVLESLNGYKYMELNKVLVSYDWKANIYKVHIDSKVPHHTQSVIKGLLADGEKK